MTVEDPHPAQVRFQLLRRLEQDGLKTQVAGRMDILGMVIDKKAFARRAADTLQQ